MSGEDSQRLKSALDMASRGMRVFPLKPGSKEPAVKGWQESATRDEAIIRRVWAHGDYNVGVLTGGGIYVVDIDVKKGKEGPQSFTALGLTSEEKDTFRVKTASGGWHVYYTIELAGYLANSSSRLGDGLDTRGDGGYVVGPGSVLYNGSGQGSYVIEHDRQLRSLPGAIRSRVAERRDPPERHAEPVVDLDRTDAVDRATLYLGDEAPAAVEGSGGDLTTYKVAAKLKDFGVSRETALDLMLEHWNDRCSPPWDVDELKEKVDHAYLYGLSPPGAAHPAVSFGSVDLDPPPAEPSRWSRHGDTWEIKQRWLYHETLPAVGVAVIVGAPQSGKTFVGVELGRSVSSGKPFFGHDPDDRGGVAYLLAGTEGSALPMRLAALGESAALPISWTTVSDLSARGALGKLMGELRTESRRMQERFGVPLRLVVLETLNASGLLTDENDNAEIGMAFANLGTLARELDCLVLTTHHPPKNGEGARGGGAIIASADYVLEINREGTSQTRYLELTKARDAEQRQLGTFTLLKVDLGEDDRGRPVTSMAVSMGEPVVRQGRRSDFSDVLMQAVDFALMEAVEAPNGHKAAEWDDVFEHFKGLKTGSKDRSKSVSAFRKAVDYARDAGALDTAIYEGVRYIWIKGTDDE